MRLAYLSLDEVNRALAATFATELEIELELYARFADLAERNTDAVLCDLDSFYVDNLEKTVGTIVIGSKQMPIAVHSYNLDEERRRFLHQNGVITARRLQGGLLSRLAAANRQTRASQTVA
jgi:hypothetical protein